MPPRRLGELARYGMTADAWLIRRHPDDRRLATLLATARYLEAKSVDDALELLDLLMSAELLNKAQTGSGQGQGPQAPAARQGVGPAGGGGGGAVRVRRLGRPGRGAAGVAGLGGDRGGRLARRPARRADAGERDRAAARRGGPGRLAGRAAGPLPDGDRVLEAAAGRDLVRGDRRGRAGAGGDAGAARRAGLPQPPARAADSRTPRPWQRRTPRWSPARQAFCSRRPGAAAWSPRSTGCGKCRLQKSIRNFDRREGEASPTRAVSVAQSEHPPGEGTSISGALPNRALTQLLEDPRHARHLVHESVACGVRGTGRSVLIAGRARRESIGWHGGWCALAAGGVRW